jgi:predicted SAM-dependent methyltransferase
MNGLKHLNVGCGNKFHKDWVNVDMVSNSPYVRSHDLLHGFPFDAGVFDVVYHSQVLEHFPKEKAPWFMSECLRVLKPGGMVRVVVPDLEDIATEYLRHLHQNLNGFGRLAEANYDWIMLEMYDQTVRNYPGGQMAEFLRQSGLVNEKYIVDRIGHVGRSIIASSQDGHTPVRSPSLGQKLKRVTLGKLLGHGLKRLRTRKHTEAEKLGAFRMGGEIHMWMYDRFSLSRLLRNTGFDEIKRMNPFESDIPEWSAFELDVRNGAVFDPTSLFMEARKPRRAA